MGDLNTLIVATVPILGVALGAALQFYFSRSAEDRKNLNTLRASAYTDFIRGVSGVAISQRGNDVGQVAANMALVADAKARIAIYGGRPEVQALARFWRGGATLDEERQSAFVEVVAATRVGASSKTVEARDISQLLFSIDV